MWIVNLALRRPYTFIVLAVLLFIIGPLAVQRTPTDIFPNIDIPVVSIVWTYNGFSAEDMAHRITSNYKRALTSDVDDIEHIESQSLNGVSVVKVFFHRRIQPVDATLPLLTQPLVCCIHRLNPPPVCSSARCSEEGTAISLADSTEDASLALL